ncbi:MULTISPECIES: hypothetical protein [Vibrio]|uniref:Uncharacterized protein n=1 Tax=Vibrio ezurae NBRC 102218 TaxID=1219080 RepID=U3AY41_9VIBR|nr:MULTISPECIES: hypothetical protein [Vibrio]MPW34866.1 hypothetical protein [Vibrio sp. B1Z05]GAD78650.1 hypothetical protein VEZ01S_05_00380 [Vibrio ezurae NBRC 102218]
MSKNNFIDKLISTKETFISTSKTIKYSKQELTYDELNEYVEYSPSLRPCFVENKEVQGNKQVVPAFGYFSEEKKKIILVSSFCDFQKFKSNKSDDKFTIVSILNSGDNCYQAFTLMHLMKETDGVSEYQKAMFVEHSVKSGRAQKKIAKDWGVHPSYISKLMRFTKINEVIFNKIIPDMLTHDDVDHIHALQKLEIKNSKKYNNIIAGLEELENCNLETQHVNTIKFIVKMMFEYKSASSETYLYRKDNKYILLKKKGSSKLEIYFYHIDGELLNTLINDMTQTAKSYYDTTQRVD